jgi:Uma2 family endonuclease
MREPITPQLHFNEFLLWEERQSEKYESHHGFVFAFAGGSVDHAQISANLVAALKKRFPAPCRSFGSDLLVQVGELSGYYPDATVICEDVDPRARFITNPRLLGEVLSPSTRAYDLVDKRAAYRAIPSLEFYVIVHTDARRIEIDRRDRNGGWTTETYESGGEQGDRLLSISEIYADSSLAE